MVRDFKVVQGTQGKPRTDGLKDTANRLRNGKENHLAHRTSMDWRLDAKLVTTEEDKDAGLVYVDALLDIIRKSRTAEALLNDETMQNVEVLFDRQTKTSQLYTKEDKVIIAVNPNRPSGELINTITRELRHAWQYNNDTLVNPMAYEPDEAILINRAQKADALVTSVKIAWELNLADESDAWNYMLASPVGAIVRTYEKEAREDFRSLNNGMASRRVYDALFNRNHSKAFDKQIIHQMLLDDVGYMKQGNKKAHASFETLAKLGDMPFSTNYIKADRNTLPTDPTYYKIEDRSNANFLWFIKFERQYQAKEVEMTKEVTKESAEIVDFTSFRKAHEAESLNIPA